MTRRFVSMLGAVLALPLAAAPAQAWFWDAPEVTPPPVHVYDYARGPVWTSNGWAYVPVEVHFPRSRPPVLATPPPPLLPPPHVKVGHRKATPRRAVPASRYPNMLEPPPKLPPLRGDLK